MKIPSPLCLLLGHRWGPWMRCTEGCFHRWCDRCRVVQ